MKNTALDAVALTLSIIGAVNWGLIGLFKFDLVAFLFGSMTLLSRIIYTIVGICGVYLISFYAKKNKGPFLTPFPAFILLSFNLCSFMSLSVHSLIISIFQAAF